MSFPYRIYDVFSESPFEGAQISVVISDDEIDEQMKLKLVSEFNHSDTVFVNQSDKQSPFSVYNENGKASFGAHTTLAAARTAHDLGISKSAKGYFEYDLLDGARLINTFIDSAPSEDGMTLYSRSFDFTIDRYVPELSDIAKALAVDVKHLSYSRYKPRLVNVDTSILVVPMTKPEHVVAARLDANLWPSLLSESYASYILLIAPGSVTGRADFHARLMHPNFKPNEFPPIGGVIPEFIAYLRTCEEASVGTHSVLIDRGGLDSRQSLIHAEFDYSSDNQAKCRIGGNVILMSQGEFVYS